MNFGKRCVERRDPQANIVGRSKIRDHLHGRRRGLNQSAGDAVTLRMAQRDVLSPHFSLAWWAQAEP